MFPKLEPAPKMSRTKAINEHCKACIYDKHDTGTWREQVERCGSQHCALWQHRPKTSATVTLNRNGGGELDLDALVNGLEDEEAETAEA